MAHLVVLRDDPLKWYMSGLKSLTPLPNFLPGFAWFLLTVPLKFNHRLVAATNYQT